ncbi:MAG: hypothetical protein EBV20_05305 [Betaproteobacteria bacterium]|nr:hypothetical protein [Betaproteobacteria bacterium]
MSLTVACAVQAQPLSFVALGDMPYGPRAQTQAPYERLIEAVNRTGLPFTLHIGDIKSGSTRCDDEEFVFQKGNLQRFATALIYTPGDNEWTDRWQAQGVALATVHVVGSNNNRDPKRPEALAEYEARDKANVAWIQSVFEWAKATQAKAVVLAMQADPFESSLPSQAFPPESGFTRSIGQTLLPLAQQSGMPVLLVHGDSHRYTFDQPFKLDGHLVANLYRLQVPGGAGDYRAVKVTAQPEQTQRPFVVELIAP